MKNLFEILSDARFEALAWTLFHSVWQGLFIALTLTVVLAWFKNWSSTVRYWLSIGALAVLLGGSILTYNFVLVGLEGSGISETVAMHGYRSMVQGSTTNLLEVSSHSPGSFGINLSGVESYLKANFPWIISLWLLGASIFLTRMIGAYFWLDRVRNHLSRPIAARWSVDLTRLSKALGVRGKVLLRESESVRVPMLVGYLKPVILFPIGLINNLTLEEVEAVLIHELAHVKRNDFLVNLITSLAETVYFFNPGYWFISFHIQAERENCCDDLAIAQLGSSLSYVKALTRIKEFEIAVPPMALAMSNGSLFHRIQRLTQRQSKRPSANNRVLLALSVSIFGSLLLSVYGFNLSLAATITHREEPNVRIQAKDLPKELALAGIWVVPPKSNPTQLAAGLSLPLAEPKILETPTRPQVAAVNDVFIYDIAANPAVAGLFNSGKIVALVAPVFGKDSLDEEGEQEYHHDYDFDFDLDFDLPDFVMPPLPPLPPFSLHIPDGLDPEDEERLRQYEDQMEEYQEKMESLQLEIEEYVQKVQQSIDHEKIQEMVEKQQEYISRIQKQIVIEIEDEARNLERDSERMELDRQKTESSLDDYFDWLSDQLAADGYIENHNSHFRFELRDNKARVNDEDVKEKDLRNYQEKYEEIFDHPMRSRLTLEN